MRLIDADALIEKCGGWYVEEGTESGFIGTLKNLLATMPTIQSQSTTGQLNDGARSTDLIDRQQALEKVRAMQTYKLFMGDDMILVDKADVQTELMMLPTVQPEPTDLNAKEAVYNLAEKIGIHQLFALTVELRGEPVQPEPHWISVTERLPDNADHPGAFCPRYQVVTPYGVTEGWYRPHDHEKGGQWFALFWFMSQIYEIWNIDFERGDVPKVIGEAPVMEWRPLPEPYKPNK